MPLYNLGSTQIKRGWFEITKKAAAENFSAKNDSGASLAITEGACFAPVFGAGSLAKILPTIFEADQWSILRGHKFGRNVLSDGGNREKRESSKGE
jgi:hypothetical protein